jgi:signal transduction histidine kinase/CheY-like chemotaxis protein
MSTTEALDMETVVEALNALGDGIAIYGQDGGQLFVNRTALERFPTFYKTIEAGGSHRDAIKAAVGLAYPQLSEAELEARTDAAYELYARGDTYATPSENGRVVMATYAPISKGRSVGISVDVTDLRQREAELKKANAKAEAASTAKSAFLANMSHEIRTPLNGILGMAQVLNTDRLDPDQKEQVQAILDSGRTLMALLNDVLDLSKIEAGKVEISRTDADLPHVLKRLYRLWKPRADEKGLELRLSFDADLPDYLHFDTVRVQQCVSNLVSNAIKFTTEGRVEVFASSRELAGGEHLIRIRVTDSGIGMDEEAMGRLFGAFMQADESTSRRFGGTGLGLNISKKLCELMGGGITVKSEPGRGSEFLMTFVAARAMKPATRRASDNDVSRDNLRSELKSSRLRILVVDDHPINRQVAGLFLRPFEARIVEAVNGVEALAALHRETFDLVLMDINMPVMDGVTCIQKIRASGEPWANVATIALTADAMSGDKEKYLGHGMNGYCSKPLDERELVTEIARVRNMLGASPHMRAAG